MGDNLPLRIKMQVRDLWVDRESPVQRAIGDLQDVLGLPVTINLDMLRLWHALSPFYSSPETFVPSIVSVIQTWIETLKLHLEDEDHGDWAGNLLDRIRGSLIVDVLPTNNTGRPKAAVSKHPMDWFFEILIPSVRPPFEVTEADFADDFSSIFRENSMEYETSFTDEVPLATVFLAQQQPQAPPVHTQQMQQPKQTILPSLETLPRPEILLRETPPYHILVEVLNDKIKVMGSHEASLSLLCGYLKKWIRNAKDMAPNTPALKIEFKESNFGYGIMRDCIVLETL